MARARRWAAYVLVAVLFAIACGYLSHWQFSRNQDRSAQLALIERNYDAHPARLPEVLAADGSLSPADEWRPVLLIGEYRSEDQVLVRNRPIGGTNAFEVLVPFRDTSGLLFLVDRGWVPPGDGDSPHAVPPPPEGEVQVLARLKPGERIPASGRGAPPGQVATINLPTIAELTGDDLVTGAYGQLIGENPAPAESLGALPSPTSDPGPYFSYAVQWILFAIMGFIFIGYMIRTEVAKHREESEGRAAAPRRRRDRDAEAEDQLIDA